MKPLRISPRADRDLDRIVAYYMGVAPEALANVIGDIDRSLNLIKSHPEMYPSAPDSDYRRHVTQRYHFKIVYRERRSRIDILGIWRFEDRMA